ncbi:FlgO family outer membrane protein [Thiopseudomonas alkaliphila]|uniref:FlgO family outer membrane protein n=1 Tax=Thiopseudomonas alkaliphila TaxID=1697053 RepID=UPI002578E9E8|nr:FlgO family outer membrane protein [Thiopseudomonas alkaliphila]
MKMRFLAPVLGALVLVTGCANTVKPAPQITYEQAASDKFIPTNYAAADRLINHIKPNISPRNTLIIATLANIDDLNSSSTLGRLVSEQISARFTQHGYRMVELKFRNDVYMAQGQGELMLTREIHDLANSHSAQAVIVGTYAESRDFVYVNLKVIQPNTNTVLAVSDFALPMNDNNRRMLRRVR